MCRKILITLYITLLPLLLLAQAGGIGTDPVPCSAGDTDPQDNSCPLDTWVWLFAVIAITIAVIHLYRKNNSLRSSTTVG